MQWQDDSRRAKASAFASDEAAAEMGRVENPVGITKGIPADAYGNDCGKNSMSMPSKNAVFVPFLRENPYQAMLSDKLGEQGIRVTAGYSLRKIRLWGAESPDAIHLHWLPKFSPTPMGIIKQVYFFVRLLLFRLMGKSVVWTVHNLHSHEVESHAMEKILATGVFSVASSIIVHSPKAKDLLLRTHRGGSSKKVECIPHGNYIDSYPNKVTREVARARLSLRKGETVFLFIGYIRPYKGVNQLIDSFKAMKDLEAKLLIVGRAPDERCLSELRERIGRDSRISLFPGFVDDDEFQIYLNASDVVVFPYRNVLTSGSIILGMSFAKPCVAPKIGCIPDYLDPEGAFLYDSTCVTGLSEALLRAYNAKQRLPSMGKYNFMKSREWDWSSIAARTASLY